MITLYTAPSLWGLPSISPPCMKLETWLRMAKLPYKAVIATAQEFATAPKGKVPFIDYQGKLVGDATLIIEMLKQKEGIDLDAHLTSVERAISLAFRLVSVKVGKLGKAHRGVFKVVEFWLENRLMLEFLPHELATQYLQSIQLHLAEQVFGEPIFTAPV